MARLEILALLLLFFFQTLVSRTLADVEDGYEDAIHLITIDGDEALANSAYNISDDLHHKNSLESPVEGKNENNSQSRLHKNCHDQLLLMNTYLKEVNEFAIIVNRSFHHSAKFNSNETATETVDFHGHKVAEDAAFAVLANMTNHFLHDGEEESHHNESESHEKRFEIFVIDFERVRVPVITCMWILICCLIKAGKLYI